MTQGEEPTGVGEESMLAQALEEIETQATYHIESSGDEVVVRFRRGGLSDQQISRFLALLELDAIRQKSQFDGRGRDGTRG